MNTIILLKLMLSFQKTYLLPPASGLVVFVLCSWLNIGFAQDTTSLRKDSIKLFKSDPNELLKLISRQEEEEEKVSVASFKEASLRESPGIK